MKCARKQTGTPDNTDDRDGDARRMLGGKLLRHPAMGKINTLQSGKLSRNARLPPNAPPPNSVASVSCELNDDRLDSTRVGEAHPSHAPAVAGFKASNKPMSRAVTGSSAGAAEVGTAAVTLELTPGTDDSSSNKHGVQVCVCVGGGGKGGC